MDEKYMEGIEVPEELLESIAGGVIDTDTERLIRSTMSDLKRKGLSQARATEVFSMIVMPEMPAECLAFIDEIWPNLD